MSFSGFPISGKIFKFSLLHLEGPHTLRVDKLNSTGTLARC